MVFMYQREGGAGHLVGESQPARQPPREGGFARAHAAAAGDHVARAQLFGKGGGKFLRLAGGAAQKSYHRGTFLAI